MFRDLWRVCLSNNYELFHVHPKYIFHLFCLFVIPYSSKKHEIQIMKLFIGAAFNDNKRPPDRNNIDAEYMSLMAELGEGPPPAPPRGGGGHMAPSAGGGRSNAAPQPLMGPQSGGGGGGRGMNSWDRGGPPGPPPPRGGGGPPGPPPNNSWNTGPRGLF